MTIRQIQYAVEVAKQGSINKAARVLYASPSTLSFSIKELEAELGMPLFVRNASGIELTPEGKRFISGAKKALSSFAELEMTVAGLKSEFLELRIAGVQSGCLLPAIDRLTAMHEVSGGPFRMKYKEGDTGEVIDAVTAGDCDIGFIYATDRQEQVWRSDFLARGLEARVLRMWPLCIILSRDDPLAGAAELDLTALADYTFVYGGDDGLTGFSNLNDYTTLNLDLARHRRYMDAQNGLLVNMLLHRTGRFTIGHVAAPSLYNEALAYVPLKTPLQARLLLIKQKHAPLSPAAEALLSIITADADIKEV